MTFGFPESVSLFAFGSNVGPPTSSISFNICKDAPGSSNKDTPALAPSASTDSIAASVSSSCDVTSAFPFISALSVAGSASGCCASTGAPSGSSLLIAVFTSAFIRAWGFFDGPEEWLTGLPRARPAGTPFGAGSAVSLAISELVACSCERDFGADLQAPSACRPASIKSTNIANGLMWT